MIRISPYLIPGAIISIDEIIAEGFGTTVEKMVKRGRVRENTVARQFAMWFRYLHTDDKPNAIAIRYSRHHATVRHAYLTIENLKETNSEFRQKVNKILNQLLKAGHGKNK